jgi:two-component system sensor histidine kinase UhpB
MLLALGSTLGVVTNSNLRRHILLACAVAAAYYLGSLLGFALRLPPTRISFLWPPTAILTAILLSIPARSWLIAVAGAFAAHAVAHSLDGIPTSTWLVQFSANCLQATLGAWLARSIDAGPVPFASFRSVTAFVIGVVLVAPAVASLVAAQVYVGMGWSPSFLTAWRTRELSNVLAALTFTPPLVVVIARLRQAGDRLQPGLFVGWRVPLLSCVLMVIATAGGGYAVSPAAAGSGLSAADRLTILQVVIAAAAVPLMFLAALLQERQAEHSQLRESQRRYALATSAGGVGVWEWSPSGRTYVDPRLSHRLGYHPHTDASIDKWWRRIHHDDRDRVKRLVEAFATAVDPFFEFECRVLNRRGSVHWLFIRGAATRSDSGRLVHVTGTYIDVTEQRIASHALAASQTRLRELAARVISVQEDERARIARNLHDSASQTLAALAIRLSVLHRDAEAGSAVRAPELAHLRDLAIATGEQIRHVSHELHPAVLQREGLPSALAGYCEAFAEDHLLRVTSACTIGNVAVSAASALCLYRVCQEALHNVAKHARASEVSVTLAATASTLQLIVRDDGCGFDQHALGSGSGIGLSSLDERLRLLNGTLAVDSRRGEGTRILATLPIAEAA